LLDFRLVSVNEAIDFISRGREGGVMFTCHARDDVSPVDPSPLRLFPGFFELGLEGRNPLVLREHLDAPLAVPVDVLFT
jgi:hypothetical protein